jgi:hypothetical protein
MIEKQFNISIMHGSLAWAAGVRADLDRIHQTQAGALLARSLRDFKSTITLIPYEGGDCNAQEGPASKAAPDISVVLFSPRPKGTACTNHRESETGAILPHESLHHELVHSLRRISGKFKRFALSGKLDLFHTNEEFYAILATNIYISDRSNRHKSNLRMDHAGHERLEARYESSYRYFQLGTKAYNLIAKFCTDHPDYSKQLAAIRANFNPLAAYYANPRKAFDQAAEGDADATIRSKLGHGYRQDAHGIYRRFLDFPKP